MTARISALKAAALERFSTATITVELLGAADLWDKIIRQPKHVRTLITQRSSAGRNRYICLVSLEAVNTFLRDDDDKVSQNIFDENVRDWQGITPVNGKIAEELKVGDDREFWWLNNGITIVCTEYRNDDNMLTITNPQIVNGLQTCKEITQYFDSLAEDHDQESRSVLAKVIRVEDEDTRDRVIRATNSQNPVSVAMLRATDGFQRTIEHYLLPRDLYYERRKIYYANRGRPNAKIISMTFMAQCVLSLFLFRPDDARARPSNPLKNDREYKDLFDPNYPLNAFYISAYICRFVELYLRKERSLPAKDVNNLRFYIAMVVCWKLAETTELTPAILSSLDIEDLTPILIDEAHTFVGAGYRRLGANDDAARGSNMKIRLKARMRRELA